MNTKKIYLMTAAMLLCGCSQPGTSSVSSVQSESESENSSIVSSSSLSSEESSEDLFSNKIQVVVMLGQSNMEGHTHNEYLSKTCSQEKTLEYYNGYNDVLISYCCSINFNTSHGEFVPVKVGQGTSIDRFGPEVGMAEYYHNAELDHPVYLIKYAQGATSLCNQWLSPSSGKAGGLYNGAVAYITEQMQKLEDAGYYPELEAICWMQGENDSNEDYSHYGEYLSNFIEDLRKDLLYYSNPSGIGFVDAGISDCPAWTHFAEINSQKEQVSAESELNYYFSTIDNNLKYNGEPAGAPDIYHYDSMSMIKLGKLFAEGTMRFLNRGN